MLTTRKFTELLDTLVEKVVLRTKCLVKPMLETTEITKEFQTTTEKLKCLLTLQIIKIRIWDLETNAKRHPIDGLMKLRSKRIDLDQGESTKHLMTQWNQIPDTCPIKMNPGVDQEVEVRSEKADLPFMKTTIHQGAVLMIARCRTIISKNTLSEKQTVWHLLEDLKKKVHKKDTTTMETFKTFNYFQQLHYFFLMLSFSPFPL